MKTVIWCPSDELNQTETSDSDFQFDGFNSTNRTIEQVRPDPWIKSINETGHTVI